MANPKQRPRDRAQRIVSDLAKRGESRTKDIQKAARGIAERSARSRRELASLVQKEIRRQIRALGLATRDEVERLQRRIRELEKGGAARKSAPKSAAKPRARKSTGR
jgi:polyhydroxyalkanoate synthesis regulator phasin